MNKYRAWDKEQKEMYGVYGWNEIDKEVYMCSVPESKFRDGSMHTWHQVTKQLDKVILMQSTGLKDKELVERYFESEEDRNTFIEEFEEVMRSNGITFVKEFDHYVFISFHLMENNERIGSLTICQ